MPLKYWRTLACALALGIGGLAVCADECLRGGAAAGKETRRAKADPKTEPPLAVVTPPVAAVTLPPPADLADPEPPARAFVLPLAQPSPPVVQASFEPPLAPKPADASPATLPVPPTPPSNPAALDLPPPPPMIGPKPEPLPAVPPTVALPPTPPPAPMLPKFDPPPAPPVSVPMPPPAVSGVVPAKTVSSTKPAAPTAQYKLFLRMGGSGQPRFEIRDGDQLLLKVTCEQIELHGAQDGTSALPGLTATGKVKLHGSGLDGTCDQLSIVSAKGEVALKGTVRLTCYRGTTSSQVAAESVMFQLTRTGETSAKMKTTSSSGVVPASVR